MGQNVNENKAMTTFVIAKMDFSQPQKDTTSLPHFSLYTHTHHVYTQLFSLYLYIYVTYVLCRDAKFKDQLCVTFS